jgi:YVTN family beta-propeller protein
VGEVDVIDTATYQVTNIPTAAGSRRLCISPAGDRVYCANYDGNSVSAIDTATKQLIATIPVGQRPRAIAITPDGREVYTADVISGTVSIINTTTLSVIATLPTGQYPWELVITADGTKAFVSNTYSDTVSVINTATHTVTATIPAGHGPFISQIKPDQTKLYVSDTRSTTVTVIDIPSLTVSATVPNVGSQPFDMAFAPGGAPTPTPTPTATPTPTPTPGPIQLIGQPRRIGGINISRLRWTGATSANVDVYRDGVVVATTPNNGSYDDNTGTSGQASFMYHVCDAATQTCSNTVTVDFP